MPAQASSLTGQTTYRPHIDGLRAIAVLSVVLFHLDLIPPGHFAVRGGFVGVDIFFVISGFLISKIIFAEQAAGTFSLLDFYSRRARRILPALLLVGGMTMFAGFFFYTRRNMFDSRIHFSLRWRLQPISTFTRRCSISGRVHASFRYCTSGASASKSNFTWCSRSL